MSDQSETVDNEVLRLRRQGQSYARISRDLGLERAATAQQAFRRALGRLPEADASRVREEEISRLDRWNKDTRHTTRGGGKPRPTGVAPVDPADLRPEGTPVGVRRQREPDLVWV